MTGTAMTEEAEFREIYKLDVIEIPTNRPMVRKDMPDVVYKTEKGKFNAVIEDIAAHHQKGQPILVGTISIEKSEQLSALLRKRGIKHEVLNAIWPGVVPTLSWAATPNLWPRLRCAACSFQRS